MSYSSYGVEKGQLIRVPSTANLMIDSADRNTTSYPSAWDFAITKNQPYVTGFFSRVGATEVVLEWCEDNISAPNNTVGLLDLSGVLTTITIPPGKYTVAQALNAIVAGFNGSALASGSVRQFSVSTTKVPGQVVIDISGLAVGVTGITTLFPLWSRLDVAAAANPTNTLLIVCPDLRPYRYIDFVSDTLTSVQDVKDASTAAYDRSVLVRWYFSYDEQNLLDQYGFPILMGYTRFCLRRLYNPPKQIKWDTNLPISNLGFQVYNDSGVLLTPASDINTQWLMTLQLSEG
jgi:hypothetical protein